ncbi:MAG TPA: hypothetical protein VFS21_29700 [Roseiflexaceae bacterium]|nr:hypothetical protein [Roseiflexaceae bacterium]
MAPKRAALLRQRDKHGQSSYRLRAGATGSGAVLASWPATLSVDEAIAAARAFGDEQGLEVVIKRAWLIRRTPVWMPDALVMTPDGAGVVFEYDGEADRYVVQPGGDGAMRSYTAGELSRVPA